jgi:hypothetical protein
MSDVVMSIDVMIAESASKVTEGDVRAKLLAAMKAVRLNTMAAYGREAELLNASVMGVVCDLGIESEEAAPLIREMKAINKLNAFLAACQAGLNPQLPELESDGEPAPIGIMGLWEESK